MTRGGLVAVMLTAAMTCLPGTAAGAAPPGGADPAAAAALSGASSGAQRALAPGAAADKPLWRQSRDYWTTLAAPRIPADAGDGKPGARARPDWFQAAVARHHTGFPPAARELARREAIANTHGPAARGAVARTVGRRSGYERQSATILVEFDPEANDDFSGWERPDDPPDPVGCVTEPAGHPVERTGPQPTAQPGHGRHGARQQHVLGPGLQLQSLQQDHLLQDGSDAEGPPRSQRRGQPSRPHGPQPLPRNVEGQYDIGGNCHAVADAPAL